MPDRAYSVQFALLARNSARCELRIGRVSEAARQHGNSGEAAALTLMAIFSNGGRGGGRSKYFGTFSANAVVFFYCFSYAGLRLTILAVSAIVRFSVNTVSEYLPSRTNEKVKSNAVSGLALGLGNNPPHGTRHTLDTMHPPRHLIKILKRGIPKCTSPHHQ